MVILPMRQMCRRSAKTFDLQTRLFSELSTDLNVNSIWRVSQNNQGTSLLY